MFHLPARKNNISRIGIGIFASLALCPLWNVTQALTGEKTTPQTSEVVMRIYFTPFAAETVLPITMEEIEERALYNFAFVKQPPLDPKGHPFIAKLQQTLVAKSTTIKIDDQEIRLKVKFPDTNAEYYVDQNGVVLRTNNTATFQLSKKQRNEIEKSLEFFSGVVDLKAHESLLVSK